MQIFLSYASEDRELADQTHLALTGDGHLVFFDRESLPPGGDYHERIRAAVQRSDIFVFLITNNSVAPGSYALTELKYARGKWPHPKGRVLPVRVGAVAWELIPPYLKAVTILEPEGNAPAEVLVAVHDLEKQVGLQQRSQSESGIAPTQDDSSAQQPASLSEIKQTEPVALTPSFDKGLYGGLIGGAVAGLIIGVLYYLASQFSDDPHRRAHVLLLAAILGYGAVAGVMFGVCAQQAILWFRYEITGGVLGGGLAGILAGALGGWWFGKQPSMFIDPGLVMIGSLLGMLCLVLGILLYDYEGRWRDVIRALVLSAVVSAFLATMGFVVLYGLNIKEYFREDSTDFENAMGGAIFGFVVYIVLGFLFGLTLRLYRGHQARSAR